jgi:FMN phosphatase YigB (HAD superfamily)
MPSLSVIVFFIDVDNTLLDNDHVIADYRAELEKQLGKARGDLYWVGFEALRDALGYVDYLGALQRLRAVQSPVDMNDPKLLQIGRFMIDYPFADRLYPGALAALQHLRKNGVTVIVSDGDIVLQPRKVEQAGLWSAVDGKVLVYVHKQRMLDTLSQLYPADHYVMIDDKLNILSAMKEIWRDRLTTVFVRQGHYAFDTDAIATLPAADITINHIADLVDIDWAKLKGHERTNQSPGRQARAA